jgi:glucosylceramidase
MNSIRASIASSCVALVLVGCGSGSSNNPAQGGSGGTRETGGASGSGGGGSGSGGSASGGSGGAAGNSGASGSGGAIGSSGAAGTGKGGAAGTGKGGATGSGGATSTGKGGASGSGGATSTGKGGATGSGGGSAGANGGSGSGGAQAGGATGAGGNATGGTTSGPIMLAITSASGKYWQSSTPTESTGTADATVNDTASQNWEGFGGAFNEKGWSYLNSQSLQDEAMQLLFGDDGCRFAWGRVPMGASDYAMDRYTDDETKGDTAMSSFSIDRDKQKLIPYIKAAQAVKSDLRFWASPWTPPTWMKDNGTFDGGNMKSDDSTLKAHAQYFVKFVQEYAKQNINIEVVAPQNEPNFSQSYPSCIWSSATFTSFVGKYLGPAIKDAGLSTKIMLGTMSKSDGNADGSIISAVMGDATAKGFIGVIGVQWGMADNIGNYKSYNLPVWDTEHKCGNYPWNPSGYPSYVEPAPNDLAYAKESWGYLRSTIKGGVTSYNAWNMVLDKMGKGIDTSRQWAQDALLVVDGGKITKTPAYYVFRHLSQYAQPGGKVLSTSGNDVIGFKNPDGSVVAVIYAQTGKSSYTVALGGKKLQFNMPSDGWATVVYKP